MYNLLFFGFFTSFLFSCSSKAEENQSKKAYDLSAPVKIYSLPKELKEISGIQYIDPSSIACIQDEKGKLFFYNPQSEKIENTITFGEDGDYEDLTKAGDDFYILKNNGTIFKYSKSQTTSYETELSKKNNTESLFFDKDNNRLIIGCKDGEKSLYAFDLKNSTLIKDPLLTITQEDVFPTAINEHPLTKEWYVLSKKKLLVITKEGIIKDEYHLSSDLFRQPEGITFKPNGDLFISNEAGTKGKNATILEFKYTNYEK